MFSGVISIKGEGYENFEKGYGFRDKTNTLLNIIDTKFGIASGTKLFTALTIIKLCEKRTISLDTKVHSLCNESYSFIHEEATLRNLLSHTSGIFDYYDEELIEDFDKFTVAIPWCKLETPKDYVPLFENEPYKFKPNERYSYSNGGFVFLAILIEKLTGKLYRDVVNEEVFLPLGMRDSGFYAFNDLPHNTAIGYLENGTSNIYALPIRGGGDGGMYTTANDMYRLWTGLFHGSFLSASWKEEFLKTVYKFDDVVGIGCGIFKCLGDSRFFTSGGDGGVGFYSSYVPKQKLCLTIFSNETNGEYYMKKILLDNPIW